MMITPGMVCKTPAARPSTTRIASTPPIQGDKPPPKPPRPSNANSSAAVKEAELVDLVNTVADAGLNAIFFQARPESDAMYASTLEPWSRFLTGTQGRDPGFDPLQVAIDAAHTRATNFSVLAGMKLVSLNLAHTRIASLGPLKAAPLRFLQLEGCTNLTDFSALAECKQLEAITLPVGAKNLDVLKPLPRLKHIGYILPEGGWDQVPLTEDFWKQHEARSGNGK